MSEKYLAYPEYKDSGVEWLGDVPSHWQISRIKYSTTLNMGQSPNSEDCNLDGYGYPFLQGNAEFGKISPIAKQYCPVPRKLANKGDLLFSVRAPVGALNIADATYGIGRGLCSLASNSQMTQLFLWWVLPSYKYQLNAISTGSTFEAVSAEQVSNLLFALPNYEEQIQIANFLDHETAQIDTLIEKQQTLIQLLKEKRQAVISHAVTPSENEKSAKLGYFVDLLSGYSFSSEGYKTEPEGNTALLRGINVGVGVLKWEETVWWSRNDKDGLQAFELEEGDIVFGMDRPWISAGARVAEVTKADLPCLLLQRVIRIRANKDTYQPFIKLCLASKEFRFSVEADLTGVSVPHISPDQVKSFAIRDVGYEQQKIITDDAFERIKVLDSIEDSAEQAIQLMQERRTALISAAVTGKIDVRGWQAPE